MRKLLFGRDACAKPFAAAVKEQAICPMIAIDQYKLREVFYF